MQLQLSFHKVKTEYISILTSVWQSLAKSVAAKFRHPVVFTTTALDFARTETSEPKITSCFIYVFHITVDSHKNVPWSTISLQVTQNDRSQSYLY